MPETPMKRYMIQAVHHFEWADGEWVTAKDAIAAVEKKRQETIDECEKEAIQALRGNDSLAARVAAKIRALKKKEG